MSRPKGFKHSQETRERIALKATGRVLTIETKEKLRKFNLGKKNPKAKNEHSFVSGIKHPLWKGGITKDPKYVSWSKNQWHHRRNEADGSHTFEEWESLKAKYNWTCPACIKREPEIRLTLDHIVPLSKGGSNNIENIQPLCSLCNSRKNNKTIKYPIIN